ncbi:tRNA-dihydrouridine(47) synthase [NAD(P)(+)]-like [Manis javanica]|nr:tRNA-dihydrouridine(47) synthase [NAD(P)(+)]-like [Manis javanica]
MAVVRGPLADGEALDLGLEAGPGAAGLQAAGQPKAGLQKAPMPWPIACSSPPMAGVTDRPFRQLCKALGAGYAVSEMVTSRKDLWNSLKTSRRATMKASPAPSRCRCGYGRRDDGPGRAYNLDRGAQIIDINMGCPAKKVCNKWPVGL